MTELRTYQFYQWENSSLCCAPAVAHSRRPDTMCSQSIHNSSRALSPSASPGLITSEFCLGHFQFMVAICKQTHLLQFVFVPMLKSLRELIDQR